MPGRSVLRGDKLGAMSTKVRHLAVWSLIAAGVLTTSCGETDDPLTHGFIKLRFQRASNQAGDPFVATASITASMRYDMCLLDLYNGQPNLREDGVEGGPVFGGRDLGGEGWLDRLCEGDDPEQADCEVTEIRQQLDIPGAENLVVEYSIPSPDIEGRFLRFGPLPTSETAECPPLMRMIAGGVTGFGSGGDMAWEMLTFDPPEAVTDQGLAISIRAQTIGQ